MGRIQRIIKIKILLFFINALGTYYWFSISFHQAARSTPTIPTSLYGTLWFVTSPDHKVFISFLCKAMPTILHNIFSNGVKDNKQMKNESNQPPTSRRHNGRTTHTNDIGLRWQYSWKSHIKVHNTITSLTLWVEYRYNDETIHKALCITVTFTRNVCLHSHQTSLQTKHVHK